MKLKDKLRMTTQQAKDWGCINSDETNTERNRTGQIRKHGTLLLKLWQETKGKCPHCGKKLTPDNFTIEHIYPVSKGGTTNLQNLTVTCEPCNKIKGALLPEEFEEVFNDTLKHYAQTYEARQK